MERIVKNRATGWLSPQSIDPKTSLILKVLKNIHLYNEL